MTEEPDRATKTGRRLRVLLAIGALVVAVSTTPAAAQTAWTQLAPTGGPPAVRAFHTAVLDEANDRIIVYGGTNGGGGLSDVWVLSSADGLGGTPTWTPLSPTGGPPSGRLSHTAVYDAANNRMIVYGGNPGGCTVFSDTWVLTNANGLGGTPTWTSLSATGAPALIDHSAVYDPATNRMIVFGGLPNSTCGVTGFSNDVWVLTNANGLGGSPAWTRLNPIGGPPVPRQAHVALYDAAQNRMIVLGGQVLSGSINDVWVLSNANGVGGTPVWTQLSPTGGTPFTRQFHVAVLDAGNNRALQFGGATSMGPGNDVWSLAGANGLSGAPEWSEAAPTGPPPVRDNHVAVYNGTSRRMIVYGGRFCSGSCAYLGDVWVLTDAPAAGSLQFSAAISEAAESAGAAVITVVRRGGTAGTVTVNYATSDGTATAGSDYTAASGTLSFAAGERIKVFSVSLTSDTAPEPNETVTLTLSSPTGGAVLGSPAAATLRILDASQPASPSWASLSRMADRRQEHTATLLLSGKVLVAGGTTDETSGIASAEVFDPVTASWSPTGSLATGRRHHVASLLANGQVLVAGGLVASNVTIASAELFDPATGSWRATASLSIQRQNATATLLPNGKALVAGGTIFGSCMSGAEVFDPAGSGGSGSWSSAGDPGERYNHTATLLQDGRVLVIGGTACTGGVASAALYSFASNTWSSAASLPAARTSHTATLLPDGRWVGRPQHYMWGWMQIESVVPVDEVVRAGGAEWRWARRHPHLAFPPDPTNTLYLAAKRLSPWGHSGGAAPGHGTFEFAAASRRLTAAGAKSPLEWSLPLSFLPRGRPALSYHKNPDRWSDGESGATLRAASRGQEFVLDLDLYPAVTDWLSGVLLDSGRATRRRE